MWWRPNNWCPGLYFDGTSKPSKVFTDSKGTGKDIVLKRLLDAFKGVSCSGTLFSTRNGTFMSQQHIIIGRCSCQLFPEHVDKRWQFLSRAKFLFQRKLYLMLGTFGFVVPKYLNLDHYKRRVHPIVTIICNTSEKLFEYHCKKFDTWWLWPQPSLCSCTLGISPSEGIWAYEAYTDVWTNYCYGYRNNCSWKNRMGLSKNVNLSSSKTWSTCRKPFVNMHAKPNLKAISTNQGGCSRRESYKRDLQKLWCRKSINRKTWAIELYNSKITWCKLQHQCNVYYDKPNRISWANML